MSRASAAQRLTSAKRAIAARLPPGAVVVAAGACHDGAIQTRVLYPFFPDKTQTSLNSKWVNLNPDGTIHYLSLSDIIGLTQFQDLPHNKLLIRDITCPPTAHRSFGVFWAVLPIH